MHTMVTRACFDWPHIPCRLVAEESDQDSSGWLKAWAYRKVSERWLRDLLVRRTELSEGGLQSYRLRDVRVVRVDWLASKRLAWVSMRMQ
jgi:hypothetical protein